MCNHKWVAFGFVTSKAGISFVMMSKNVREGEAAGVYRRISASQTFPDSGTIKASGPIKQRFPIPMMDEPITDCKSLLI